MLEQVSSPAPALGPPAWPPWLRALSIDIESNPAAGQGQRIFRLAAMRCDAALSMDLDVARAGRAEVCRRVDEVTAGAAVVVGHNVRRHDLPELAEQFPQAHCLALPLIDTLELSAIAFPRNPYHRLVKGYKLLSDACNEPLLDARLALELLADEIRAFEALHASESAWCGLLHRLLRHEPALDDLFAHVRAQAAPTWPPAVRPCCPTLPRPAAPRVCGAWPARTWTGTRRPTGPWPMR